MENIHRIWIEVEFYSTKNVVTIKERLILLGIEEHTIYFDVEDEYYSGMREIKYTMEWTIKEIAKENEKIMEILWRINVQSWYYSRDRATKLSIWGCRWVHMHILWVDQFRSKNKSSRITAKILETNVKYRALMLKTKRYKRQALSEINRILTSHAVRVNYADNYGNVYNFFSNSNFPRKYWVSFHNETSKFKPIARRILPINWSDVKSMELRLLDTSNLSQIEEILEYVFNVDRETTAPVRDSNDRIMKQLEIAWRLFVCNIDVSADIRKPIMCRLSSLSRYIKNNTEKAMKLELPCPLSLQNNWRSLTGLYSDRYRRENLMVPQEDTTAALGEVAQQEQSETDSLLQELEEIWEAAEIAEAAEAEAAEAAEIAEVVAEEAAEAAEAEAAEAEAEAAEAEAAEAEVAEIAEIAEVAEVAEVAEEEAEAAEVTLDATASQYLRDSSWDTPLGFDCLTNIELNELKEKYSWTTYLHETLLRYIKSWLLLHEEQNELVIAFHNDLVAFGGHSDITSLADCLRYAPEHSVMLWHKEKMAEIQAAKQSCKLKIRSTISMLLPRLPSDPLDTPRASDTRAINPRRLEAPTNIAIDDENLPEMRIPRAIPHDHPF